MNAKTGTHEHSMNELKRYCARCVAGLMIAGIMVAAPMQTGYAMSEEAGEAESPAVEIEECIAAEEEKEVKTEKKEEAVQEKAVQEASQEISKAAEEAESEPESCNAAEISDAAVPMASGAEEAVVIEDEAVPMVLSANVFKSDEMKDEAEDIDITIKGEFTDGTKVNAWPVRAEGKEFAAYEIVITDAEGKEIHSESADGRSITVTINDPELTKGLEARQNISGSHKNNGGKKDADFEYEILSNGGVRFEADVF